MPKLSKMAKTSNNKSEKKLIHNRERIRVISKNLNIEWKLKRGYSYTIQKKKINNIKMSHYLGRSLMSA